GADDDPRLEAAALLALRPREAAVHGPEDLEPVERVVDVPLRREAHLEVPDVLLGRVLRELVGGALEGLGGLEDAADDVEGEEVLDEALALEARAEDARERPLGAVLGETVAERLRERADL